MKNKYNIKKFITENKNYIDIHIKRAWGNPPQITIDDVHREKFIKEDASLWNRYTSTCELNNR